MKLLDLMNNYIKQNDGLKAPETVISELSFIRSISQCFDFLKIIYLEDLKFESYNDIVKFYKANSKKKNASINKLTTFLKSVIRYFGYHTHPFLLVKKLKNDTTSVKPIQNDDLIEIFRYVDMKNNHPNDIVYRTVIRLLYATGCRIGELLNIQIKNIDLKHKQILLEKTKTRKERYVFFPEKVKLLLHEYLELNPQGEWLFWNIAKNRRLSKNDIRLFNDRMKNKLDIRTINSRQFRKTMATDLVRATGNIKMAQVILGHTDIKMTQVYVDYSSEQAKEAYEDAINKLPIYQESKTIKNN